MPPMFGQVETVSLLGQSMVRVVLGGDGLEAFEPTQYTDEYVNALFLPDDAPYAPPFDLEEARSLEADLRPRPRRFTVRAWDADLRLMTIDFVTHGDAGYAGRWAQQASHGDRLQMIGPNGSYRPDPDADWYLFGGDESALPAINRSIETVPRGRSCHVFVVVDGADDEFDLRAPATSQVHWLHRTGSPSPETLLVDAVSALDWNPGLVDVFVHGEAGEVRSTRRHLVGDRGIDRASMSISPYWRRHHDDEAWRAIKRQWLEDQDRDV